MCKHLRGRQHLAPLMCYIYIIIFVVDLFQLRNQLIPEHQQARQHLSKIASSIPALRVRGAQCKKLATEYFFKEKSFKWESTGLKRQPGRAKSVPKVDQSVSQT